MQDAASVHHTLCKHEVHPSCPGQGVAGKAGDLGTPRLHAVPMPNPPPRQSTRRPPLLFSPGGQGPGPASRHGGYLSSCSQHLGGGISSPGWSLGLGGSVGKGWREAREGEAGASRTGSGEDNRKGMEGWMDGWLKGWMNKMDRSQQLLITATPVCTHETLPECLHPCHELGRAQRPSPRSRFPPRPPPGAPG